jgi:hypothetical protein
MTSPTEAPHTAAGRLFVAYEDANDEGAGNSLGHLLGIRHWTIRDVILAIEAEARAASVPPAPPPDDEGHGTVWHYCDFDSRHHLADSVERLARVLPSVLNFRIPLALPATDERWREIASELLGAAETPEPEARGG